MPPAARAVAVGGEYAVAYCAVRLEERIRIGIVGLGWVGQEVARAALEDPRVTLVGIADEDPIKAGRDLGELIGEGRLGVPIDADLDSMLARARPEVAVVCTSSDVEALGATLEACVAQGAHVVTTCENLADPDLALSQLQPDFDERVREAGVVVLATGVNPGFAMDRLVVTLAQATRNIRRIRVRRVVNASAGFSFLNATRRVLCALLLSSPQVDKKGQPDTALEDIQRSKTLFL